MDYHVDHPSEGYTEFVRYRDARIAEAAPQGQENAAKEAVPLSSGKEQYLKNKRDASEARKLATRIERMRREAKELEERLGQIEEELNGEAATDYVRAAALDTERQEKETRLLEVYEELEALDHL